MLFKYASLPCFMKHRNFHIIISIPHMRDHFDSFISTLPTPDVKVIC